MQMINLSREGFCVGLQAGRFSDSSSKTRKKSPGYMRDTANEPRAGSPVN